MRVFGLTGGIGSGKSSAARLFREYGVPIVDADALAKKAVEPGTQVLRAIADEFGPGYLDITGSLDRKRMGELVFSDLSARKRLNDIVHPEVRRRAAVSFHNLEEEGTETAGYDVPLLFETGMTDYKPVVVVWASEDTCLRRIVDRDGLEWSEARRRVAAQIPIDEKAGKADIVIWNDGSTSELRTSVQTALDALRSKTFISAST